MHLLKVVFMWGFSLILNKHLIFLYVRFCFNFMKSMKIFCFYMHTCRLNEEWNFLIYIMKVGIHVLGDSFQKGNTWYLLMFWSAAPVKKENWDIFVPCLQDILKNKQERRSFIHGFGLLYYFRSPQWLWWPSNCYGFSSVVHVHVGQHRLLKNYWANLNQIQYVYIWYIGSVSRRQDIVDFMTPTHPMGR